MTPGQPDIQQQVPAGGGVSSPASGTYGEKAGLARLEAALPGADPAQSQETVGLPPVPGGPTAAPPPQGLPSGLMAPTRQPDMPVSTPLANPNIIIGHGMERRVALLRALSESPDVSAETKEWSQIILRHLRTGSSSTPTPDGGTAATTPYVGNPNPPISGGAIGGTPGMGGPGTPGVLGIPMGGAGPMMGGGSASGIEGSGAGGGIESPIPN